MNDDRHQVYLNFVNVLLACDESEIESHLRHQTHLIDTGLLQTLSEVTEFLTWGRDRTAADRLRHVSDRILKLLGDENADGDLTVLPLTKDEGDRLVQQGAKQYQASQFRQALKSWQQALSIYQAIGDAAAEAQVLSNMGVALKSLGQYQQAIEHYQQSVAIRREGGDRRLFSSNTQDNRSVWVEHHVEGEFHQGMRLAIEHFHKQLKLAHSIGDRLVEAKSLYNLGKAHEALGQPQKALDYHQQSIAIQRLIGDRQGELESLELLGKACEALDRSQDAIAYYQQQLTLARDCGNPAAVSSAYRGWGNAAFNLQDYAQTLDCYQQGLAIAQAQNNDAEVSMYLSGLGKAHHALADYDQAVNFYEQSLTIKQKIGDRFGEAVVLDNLSKAYSALKDYQNAMQYHQKSLAIKRAIGYE